MYKKPGTYLIGPVLDAPRTYGAVAELAILPSELLTSIRDIAFSLYRRQRFAADGLNDLPNDEPVANLKSRETKTSASQSHAWGPLCLTA
jgi:hypothetical protein